MSDKYTIMSFLEDLASEEEKEYYEEHTNASENVSPNSTK
jgi:hypothetical protein